VNLVRAFDEKTSYCITEKPIIKETEFESVSEVYIDYANQKKSANLKLSDKGFAAIKTIMKTFPNNKLLLVVKGKVVGLFNTQGIVKQLMPISGSLESREIDWLFNNVTVIKKNKDIN
jgi:hypothetical protein